MADTPASTWDCLDCGWTAPNCGLHQQIAQFEMHLRDAHEMTIGQYRSEHGDA